MPAVYGSDPTAVLGHDHVGDAPGGADFNVAWEVVEVLFTNSAAADTRVNAGAQIFGILFDTNAEVSDAQFSGNGHATVYGAVVMDGSMQNFNGTFQVVYIDQLINRAASSGGLASVQGGWTDFHPNWK